MSSIHFVAPARGTIKGDFGHLAQMWAQAAQVWLTPEEIEELTPSQLALAVRETLDEAVFEHRLVADPEETFRWDGVFTRGRWVELTKTGGGWTLRWETGTGRPSGYIGRCLVEATPLHQRLPLVQAFGLSSSEALEALGVL